jgi:transketolase
MEPAQLTKIAKEIRIDILEMIHAAGSGHPAGSLDMTDIFTTLYFEVLNHNPKKPLWENRDYLILSNGHICPVLYATLAKAGYFKKAELKTLRKLDSRLQGHPHASSLPGIENSSGPLGQGFSFACGLALALKKDNKKNKIFCLMSDGEQQEGQVWESYMFASKYNLNNLIGIIDRNQIQISGNTKDIMPLESLRTKLIGFGLEVLEINGHDFTDIANTLNAVKTNQQKPAIIIANTVPGKGVSFMENDHAWHGKALDSRQLTQAIKELNAN